MPETSTALIDQLVYIDNFLNNGTGDTPQLDVDGQLSLDLAAFADDSFIFPDEDKPKHPHDDDNHDDFSGGRGHDNAAKLPNLDGHMSHDIDTNWLNEPHQNSGSFDFNGNEPSEGRKALANINLRSRDTNLNQNLRDDTRGLSISATDSHPAGPVNGAVQESHGNFLSAQHQDNGVNIPDLSHLPKFPVPPGAESSLIQAGLSHSQIDLLAALIAQHQSALGNPAMEKKSHDIKQQTEEDARHSLKVEPPMVLPSPSPIMLAHTASRGGRNATAMESPESINSNYSSGYNSGSVLSTPQLGSRSSTGGPHGGGPHTEVDKRKRNTEASARFRVKRKLREKEMENRMLQLDDLIKNFEVKINELEMENRLLKNLIIEKGDQRSTQELQMLKEKARRR